VPSLDAWRLENPTVQLPETADSEPDAQAKLQGNVSAAARELGIHRQSLQQMMAEPGIKRGE
jgi:transcriptional regulator of acetoin/glycerol metabolism